MSTADRIERDQLGELPVPRDALYGVHTVRAVRNFRCGGRPVHRELVHAYGLVKLACARVNRSLGVWRDDAVADAIEQACREMAAGALDEHVVVDALQGGAGTSTNMNVNEVIANRALQILGRTPGSYDTVSPLDDINRHQSTNDTFPTALRIAALTLLQRLEGAVVEVQEAFQRKEREFAGIVTIARTELQDAVLTTLGRTMGGCAEAFSRDRWRISKCTERLRVVNLGATAAGTGIGAPREYIFRVTDVLRELTGLPLARAENLVDATRNADVFVEVSGILKALAVTLVKVSNDLRLLASGPDCGIGEIVLEPVQAGSSIMPGKVNPVLLESAAQAGLLACGHDAVIAAAVAGGNLDLSQFYPLIAYCLLESLDVLREGCRMLGRCAVTMSADAERCRRGAQSPTALLTVLVAHVGYERAAAVAAAARREGCSIRDAAVRSGLLTAEAFDELVRPENVCRLGTPAAVPESDAGISPPAPKV
jgi:aspartate ammonia-lyase